MGSVRIGCKAPGFSLWLEDGRRSKTGEEGERRVISERFSFGVNMLFLMGDNLTLSYEVMYTNVVIIFPHCRIPWFFLITLAGAEHLNQKKYSTVFITML